MANRIAVQIADCKQKCAETDKEALDELNTALDMGFEEHFMFQNLKSLAYMHGVITLDEANLLYRELGNAVSVFNGKPVWVKTVLTGVFRELLNAKIKGVFNCTAKRATATFGAELTANDGRGRTDHKET